jgi:hypothetical protein
MNAPPCTRHTLDLTVAKKWNNCYQAPPVTLLGKSEYYAANETACSLSRNSKLDSLVPKIMLHALVSSTVSFHRSNCCFQVNTNLKTPQITWLETFRRIGNTNYFLPDHAQQCFSFCETSKLAGLQIRYERLPSIACLFSETWQKH